MEKRMLSLLMAGTMALSVVACGQSNTSGSDTGSSSAGSSQSSDDDIKIALLMSHQTNAFTTAVTEGAVAAGAELGIQVDVFDGGQDQAKQSSQIEQCISLGYDGILVEPISVDGIAPAVKLANDANIPVITTIQRMTQQELAVSFCGGNDANAGKLQMEMAMEEIGGTGNIVVLYGPMGSDAQLIRKEGYDIVLAEYPDVNIVFEDTANWTTEEALSKMETWLQTGTEINAVVAQNDSMALGAIKAVEDAGMEIPVFGVDAVPEGIEAVAAGRMAGTVSQNAKGQGILGVNTMYQYLTGETIEEINYTECIWVTAANVAEYQ